LRQERGGLLYGPYEDREKMDLCYDWYDNGPPQGIFNFVSITNPIDYVSKNSNLNSVLVVEILFLNILLLNS